MNFAAQELEPLCVRIYSQGASRDAMCYREPARGRARHIELFQNGLVSFVHWVKLPARQSAQVSPFQLGLQFIR